MENKEIFIIHTKASDIEASVFNSIESCLQSYGYSTWLYGDWEWEKEVSNTTYKSYGRKIDYKRLERGNQRPFKHYIRDEIVDRETLEHMMVRSRALIIIHPTNIRLSAGVDEELNILRKILNFVKRQDNVRGFLFLINQNSIMKEFSRIPFDETILFGDVTSASKDQINVITQITALLVSRHCIEQSFEYERRDFIDNLIKPKDDFQGFPFFSLKDDVKRANNVINSMKDSAVRASDLILRQEWQKTYRTELSASYFLQQLEEIPRKQRHHASDKLHSLQRIIQEAIHDAKWITWSGFRDHLACSSNTEDLGKLFDPFTFTLVHRYLNYYVYQIKNAIARDSQTSRLKKAELVNSFINKTFLNHLFDCFWASYVVSDVITDLFETCSLHHLELGFGFKRYEYNKKGWERMENEILADLNNAKWYETIREFAKNLQKNTGLLS